MQFKSLLSEGLRTEPMVSVMYKHQFTFALWLCRTQNEDVQNLAMEAIMTVFASQNPEKPEASYQDLAFEKFERLQSALSFDLAERLSQAKDKDMQMKAREVWSRLLPPWNDIIKSQKNINTCEVDLYIAPCYNNKLYMKVPVCKTIAVDPTCTLTELKLRIVHRWNLRLFAQGFLQFPDFYPQDLPKRIMKGPVLPFGNYDLQEYLKDHRVLFVYGDTCAEVQSKWPQEKKIRSIGFVNCRDNEGEMVTVEVEKHENGALARRLSSELLENEFLNSINSQDTYHPPVMSESSAFTSIADLDMFSPRVGGEHHVALSIDVPQVARLSASWPPKPTQLLNHTSRRDRSLNSINSQAEYDRNSITPQTIASADGGGSGDSNDRRASRFDSVGQFLRHRF